MTVSRSLLNFGTSAFSSLYRKRLLPGFVGSTYHWQPCVRYLSDISKLSMPPTYKLASSTAFEVLKPLLSSIYGVWVRKARHCALVSVKVHCEVADLAV